MRLLNIISLANEYFFIGFIGSLILCSIFLLFWFILYKRILKGAKNLPKKKLVLALISICYMSLIIGIVFIRQSSSYHSVNLHLFRSYREAWNTFSVYEWTNLVLNILIFVPLGFLLPLWSDKLRKLWKVILISVSISAAIECIQYITHHGVLDIDDIFNNSTGSLIGYGFVMIILTITHTEKRKWIKAAGYCLPFLAVLTAFSTIFICYHNQRFGNLPGAASYRIDMSEVQVASHVTISDEAEYKAVYSLDIASRNDTYAFSEAFFKILDTEVDETRIYDYEDTIVYNSLEQNLSLWVNFKGLTYRYTDLSSSGSKVEAFADEEKVRQTLSRFGINIPGDAQHTVNEDHSHTFSVDMLVNGESILNGTVTCKYYTDGTIKDIQNNLVKYKFVEECPVISEKAAYEKLKEGYFIYPDNDKLKSIEIKHIQLVYSIDSKGFFQPVYKFVTLVNGIDTEILIPALL